jgi:glycosyltransferase involved in cell wall biosynthesis
MRILFLSPRQCWPPVSGAKLREYHMARSLGELGELTYVFFQEPGLKSPSRDDLPFCRELVPVPQPRLYSPDRLLRGLVGKWPLTVVNYTSAAMTEALGKAIRESNFDLVHMDIIHMAGYQSFLERELPGARIFYNWHNIESELMRRFGKQASSLPKRLYAAVTARKLAAAEKYVLSSASGHLVCSQREREQLLSVVPDARIHVIANGVDTKYFRETPNAAVSRKRIVFVGSMGYHANIDAAASFTRNIWPGIHQRFSDWKLTLVGSNPVTAVKSLSEMPGVEVTGTVPDVRPYYAEALAAIVPLRSGSGTRLKILEALAAGVPVVSTAVGAEGLEVSHGKEILIVSDEDEWLHMLTSVAEPGAVRANLIQAGRQLVEQRYDWDALGAELRDTYRDWLKH